MAILFETLKDIIAWIWWKVREFSMKRHKYHEKHLEHVITGTTFLILLQGSNQPLAYKPCFMLTPSSSATS